MQEVIDNGGEAVHALDYINNGRRDFRPKQTILFLGRFTNFRVGTDITNCLRRSNNFQYFSNWPEGWYPGWGTDDVEVELNYCISKVFIFVCRYSSMITTRNETLDILS